jgi:hypothetical protein
MAQLRKSFHKGQDAEIALSTNTPKILQKSSHLGDRRTPDTGFLSVHSLKQDGQNCLKNFEEKFCFLEKLKFSAGEITVGDGNNGDWIFLKSHDFCFENILKILDKIRNPDDSKQLLGLKRVRFSTYHRNVNFSKKIFAFDFLRSN